MLEAVAEAKLDALPDGLEDADKLAELLAAGDQVLDAVAGDDWVREGASCWLAWA